MTEKFWKTWGVSLSEVDDSIAIETRSGKVLLNLLDSASVAIALLEHLASKDELGGRQYQRIEKLVKSSEHPQPEKILIIPGEDATYEGDRDSLIGVYAHALLEERLGFDLVEVAPGINDNIPEGCHSVDVHGYKGDCILYLWRSADGRQRGLICDTSDLKGREDAISKMQQRAALL